MCSRLYVHFAEINHNYSLFFNIMAFKWFIIPELREVSYLMKHNNAKLRTTPQLLSCILQEDQLMLTTGSTHLAVSRGQQT